MCCLDSRTILPLSSDAVFDEDGVGYSFVANSAKEQDEWRTAIATTRWVNVMVVSNTQFSTAVMST